ncbi:hypothetical protein EYR38_001951 [Pleurotus pulmonarius]|nr:hypothetical protein EYR38_001951 [Pleurotus pulmonarius]
MIFSSFDDEYPSRNRTRTLHTLLFVSRRVHAIVKPLLYACIVLYPEDCCLDSHLGYRLCLDSLVSGLTADRASITAFVQDLDVTIPEYVDDGIERWPGETLDVLLPHLPNLRKLTLYYLGRKDEWPVSGLAWLPNPAQLTLLQLHIVHDYPAFLAFLRVCPSLEYLAVVMVQDKNGHVPDTIPPDVVPRLRSVCCGSDFLYFCILAGRHIENIDMVACDIISAISDGADMDALAAPMAVAQSVVMNGEMDLEDVLRADIVPPYSHVKFLAIQISDEIDVDDVHAMCERWPKEICYLFLQCEGFLPDHDTIAEAFFSAMPSLLILDTLINVCNNGVVSTALSRCSRYFRGSPMEKDTEIKFRFPSYFDFQEPFGMDEVRGLIQHRLRDGRD